MSSSCIFVLFFDLVSCGRVWVIILSVDRYGIQSMIFNSNKEQLLEAIRQKIKQIDAQCGFINHEIHKYSQDRVDDLALQAHTRQKQNQQLQMRKHSQNSALLKLKNELQFLEGEAEDIARDHQAKKQQKTKIERNIAFLEEKLKQQAPHLPEFIAEKGKSKENSTKVRYAKEKLKKLNEKLKKQWEEVQYQYRLNNLIRQQLREAGKASELSNHHKGSKLTATCSASEETPCVAPFKSKGGELSEFDSISATFRD